MLASRSRTGNGMNSRGALTLPIVATALAGLLELAAGQVADSTLTPGAGENNPDFRVDLRVSGGHLGNFFQAPAGTPGEDVMAGRAEARVTFSEIGSNLRIQGNMGSTLYSDFDPSASFLAGVRWIGGTHLLEGDVSLQTHSPRMEVGDTLGFADVFLAEADYKVRPWEDLQVGILAGYDRQIYSRSGEKDNHAFLIGGSGRFFGLGYLFSPELGAAVGRRSVQLAEEDYDERALWVSVRSVPIPAVYLSMRYRNRLREYRSDDPASRNFRREDDRMDLTLSVDLSLNNRWGWTVYVSYQDARSTKESRTFKTHYFWTGLTYRLR